MPSELKNEKERQGALDQVILGIAHELNNPNAFVRMNVTNLKKMFWMLRPCLEEYGNNHPEAKFGPYTLPELQSKFHQHMESILDATVRIIVIADKLKHSTSDLLEHASEVSLLDIVREMIEAHRFLLDGRAEVNFVVDETKTYRTEGYRLQLEQAVSSLLTNACDAIVERFGGDGDKGGKLDISLSEEGDKIILRLCDNGCGMPEETLEKAFVPYFTTKPQGAGDGLGLSMCGSQGCCPNRRTCHNPRL